jgi:hypothetical protein
MAANCPQSATQYWSMLFRQHGNRKDCDRVTRLGALIDEFFDCRAYLKIALDCNRQLLHQLIVFWPYQGGDTRVSRNISSPGASDGPLSFVIRNVIPFRVDFSLGRERIVETFEHRFSPFCVADCIGLWQNLRHHIS